MIILFCVVVLFCEIVFSTEFFDIQKNISNNTFIVSTYVNYNELYSKFHNVETQKILLDLNGNTYQYFSSVFVEYGSKLSFKSYKVSLVHGMTKSFFSSFKFGILADKVLVFDSSTLNLSSKISDNNFGINFCIVGGYVLFPETFVSPSVIGNLSVDYYGFNFNTINDSFTTNAKLNLVDYSLGFSVTKKISLLFYPYIGVRVILRTSEFLDIINNYNVSGKNFLLKASIGNMINLDRNGVLNIEYSWSEKDFSISFGFIVSNIVILKE